MVACPRVLAPEEWTALIPEAHEAYINWEELEQNVQRLRATLKRLAQNVRRVLRVKGRPYCKAWPYAGFVRGDDV